MATLLIVEDHHALAIALGAAAERSGLRTRFAPSLGRARELLHQESFDGILLDIGLPDGNGLELVSNWQWTHKPQIAVITAHGQIENAIFARKIGISRFFDKPVDFEEMQAFFDSVAASARLAETPVDSPAVPSPFVGASPAMRPVFRQISHACASEQPVVIRGATGTGRSLVTRIIEQGTGAGRPVCRLHASSLTDGNEITEAVQASQDGQLIIESVHTLTPELQTLLVGRLDGSGKLAPRLIVTVDDEGLLPLVNEGRFDQELYYRLQILEVSLPPLEKRIEDIPAISDCFIGELAGTTRVGIGDGVLGIFANYDWPGNLRELRNVINFALVTSAGAPLITPEHIPDHLAGIPRHHAKDGALSHSLECWVDREIETSPDYKELSAKLEDLLLRILLRRFDGKSSHLAAALSINRSTLRKKLNRADG